MKKAYLQLHTAVLLWGFTAILGKFIVLTGLILVWWRMGLTTASLLALSGVRREAAALPRRSRWQLGGIGLLVMLHWVAFYSAVKASNASIAVSGLATTSFMTAFLEPLLLRTRIKWYEIGLGLLIMPGIYFLFSVDFVGSQLGLVLSLLAAFLAALFSTLNKAMVAGVHPYAITFYEIGAGWVGLSVIVPFFIVSQHAAFVPDWSSLGWLVVLCVCCTTFPFIISLSALKHISSFAANLAINLETVYTILIAWLFLGENKQLTTHFYIGIVIIMLAVLAHPFVKQMVEGKAA